MHTLRLHISDKVYDKLLWFLNRFDKSEIEIVQENTAFSSNKEYLSNELDKLNSNQATFVSSEDLNNSIDEIISNYEH